MQQIVFIDLFKSALHVSDDKLVHPQEHFFTFGTMHWYCCWPAAISVHCNKSCIHSFISIMPWRPGLAGTRAQSCDRYGSGTLHPGQVLGGSLPLLPPAFRRSHFSRQVPPSATTWEMLKAKSGTVGEKDCPVVILPKFRLPRKFRDLLHAANLRHGTDGFTSPPEEGVLRIFSP